MIVLSFLSLKIQVNKPIKTFKIRLKLNGIF